MPVFRPKLANGEIYHIYNRGVEKRTVFLSECDYLRFIHDLFEFNDTEPVPQSNIRLLLRRPGEVDSKRLNQCLGVRPPNIKKRRELLVELMTFSLMPNHYHLLVRQLIDGGTSLFMKKIGAGYTNYFNLKYERVGPLFQGVFKMALIKNEDHFLFIPHYIHLNCLDREEPKWREGIIENAGRAMGVLGDYRWSSYLDYIGIKNFPSVTQRDFLMEFLGGPGNYKKETWGILKKIEIETVRPFLLE